MNTISRRALLGAAAGGLIMLGQAQSAHAASPSVAGGSCVWESGSGIQTATGPSSSVTAGPFDSPGLATEDLVACTAPLVRPLSAYTGISSPFGVRVHPITGARSMHYGTDFARGGIRGTPILSIAAGTVVANVESYARTGAGNTIVIAHAGNVRSQYMHMNARSGIPVGAKVAAGQVIGYVGSTGGSTGPHLHLEVRVNNTHIDPAPYLANAPYLR